MGIGSIGCAGKKKAPLIAVLHIHYGQTEKCSVNNNKVV